MNAPVNTITKQINAMGDRLGINGDEMHSILLNTVMPSKGTPTNEQFVSFMAIANEYKLNPLAKEIYAFPTKGGGIQPIVSIDGWLKIINSNDQFDGMEYEDILSDGELIAIKCNIYRKDRTRPIQVTEYMEECRGETTDKWNNPTPWGRWPSRMLRHKATIQAARMAFGLSGIIDPDEGERFEQAGVITTKDMGPVDEVDTRTGEVMQAMDSQAEEMPMDEAMEIVKTIKSAIDSCQDMVSLEQCGKDIAAVQGLPQAAKDALRAHYTEHKKGMPQDAAA